MTPREGRSPRTEAVRAKLSFVRLSMRRLRNACAEVSEGGRPWRKELRFRLELDVGITSKVMGNRSWEWRRMPGWGCAWHGKRGCSRDRLLDTDF